MNRLKRLRTSSSNPPTSGGPRKSKTLSSSVENILGQKDGNTSSSKQSGDSNAECATEKSSNEDVPYTCQELNSKSVRTRSLKWTKGKFSATGIYKRLNKGYSVDSLTLSGQNESGRNKPVSKSNSGGALWSNYAKRRNRSKDNLAVRVFFYSLSFSSPIFKNLF